MTLDEFLTRAIVVASAVGATSKNILLNLRGIASGEDDPDAEQVANVPLFSALGIVARPLDADDDGSAEGIAARVGDSMWPFALIDRRITKARGEVAKGVISLAGYRGAHLTIDDSAEQTTLTISVPSAVPLRLILKGAAQTIEVHGAAAFAPNQSAIPSAVPVALATPTFAKLNALVAKVDAALGALSLPPSGIVFQESTDAAASLKAAAP